MYLSIVLYSKKKQNLQSSEHNIVHDDLIKWKTKFFRNVFKNNPGFPVINSQTMGKIFHAWSSVYKMASGWVDTPGYLKSASKLTFFVVVDKLQFIKCLARTMIPPLFSD